MFRDIDKLCVRQNDSVRKVIKMIDDGQCGIVLEVDEERRLIRTITDGDIRRALLAGQDIDAPIRVFLAAKTSAQYTQPETALVGTPPAELLARMQAGTLRQMPLLGEDGRVMDLAVLQDLLPASAPALRAVIMAGGFGTRLLPLTEDLPKPMLPIGGRPLMEHIIEQLQQAGIRHVNVSTHYMPEKIIGHFGDGQAFGVALNYVNEDYPLGTGGALGLMSRPTETQLVINGDILTQVDFGAMLAFHQDNQAALTVAVRRYDVQVPYGVIECDGAQVTALKEKPHVSFLVNAGVYLLEPSVYEFIPSGQHFNMTDLIGWLLEAGRTVISFPIREYWMDVGQHGDYAQAQDDVEKGKVAR
jgi:dTDP-glucose pyrophosphorylase/CBS domain-containing protein